MDTGSYLVFGGYRIRTWLVVGLGVIGAFLLVFGIIFSIYGFSAGFGLAVLGLIIVVVSIIVYVLATDGIGDTGLSPIFSGPA